MDSGKNRFQLTELYMAKADWKRCFHGSIKRLIDEDGAKYVYGEIQVRSGYIIGRAEIEPVLGENLDELVILILDYDLHNFALKTIDMSGFRLYLN